MNDKNDSSPTIFVRKIHTWSHSKEKMKLYNLMQAFLEFRFRNLDIEFSSVSRKIKKTICRLFFVFRHSNSKIQKTPSSKCRKNISLSFNVIPSSRYQKLWDESHFWEHLCFLHYNIFICFSENFDWMKL